MPTANDHITRALYLNGGSSPINKASAETLTACLQSFNDLVEAWASKGYVTGLTRATALADVVNNEEWANEVIQYTLAVRLSPLVKAKVSDFVISEQRTLMRDLKSKTRLAALNPDAVGVDARLPVGSGIDRGSRNRSRFFGNS